MSRTVRYRLVNKIAHGGMAEIFLAVQKGAEGFEKQVVLKRILPAFASDPSFVRMLVDEAHIASTLNHSNLVQVLDLGKSQEEFFLVLEFVDGWSLEHVRRRAQKARMKLPLPLALYVTGALCRALAYVHTRKRRGRPLGIVHRDVNPQNVLLSREGEVKLADFGIAKAIGRTEKSATGVIKGKFAYMSPEQSIGGELDARSDLFAVGTLLYILTTGKKPFEGATDLDLLMQVRRARFEKPSNLVKDFNPDVERFIARALRADRARRWQSAGQMADRIDAILLKLGQPFGPAPLKRWLDNLSAKDGVKPPAELTEPTALTGTVQLGSRDIELHDLAPTPTGEEGDAADGGGANEDADAAVDAAVAPDTDYSEDRELDLELDSDLDGSQPNRDGHAPGLESAAPARAEEDDPYSELDAAPELSAASAADVSPRPARPRNDPRLSIAAASENLEGVPRLVGRAHRSSGVARWFARVTLRTLIVLVLLASTAYFSHPYLPARFVEPVKAWLHHLPVLIRSRLAHLIPGALPFGGEH